MSGELAAGLRGDRFTYAEVGATARAEMPGDTDISSAGATCSTPSSTRRQRD